MRRLAHVHAMPRMCYHSTMKRLALPKFARTTSDRASVTPQVATHAWAIGLTLLVLTIGAFLLRVWTIRQSLPYVDHPDEPNPIDYVVGMLRTGNPNQQFFQKPSLFIYLVLAAISAVNYWGLFGASAYGDLREFIVTTHTVTTVPAFFMAARLITASFGALSVLAAFGLGMRGWNRAAGLVGAAFVALLPYHLRFSQWATTDVTAAFLVVMSLSAALLAVRSNRWAAFLVSGAFAGLAASAKYNAGAVAGAIIVAALWPLGTALWAKGRGDRRQGDRATGRQGDPQPTANRQPQRNASSTPIEVKPIFTLAVGQLGRLALAGVTAIGGFIAGTPYAILSWGQVGGGIARQWTNYGGANGHYRGAWNVAGYSQFFIFEGLGRIGCVLVVIGLGLLALRQRQILAVWLGFALPSLLIHLSRPTHFMQNMLPLLVACALPIGVAVVEGARVIGQLVERRGKAVDPNNPAAVVRRPSFVVPVVALLLTALLLIPQTLGAAAIVGRQAAGDSRAQLAAWMAANVPPGARVAAEIVAVPGPTEARWVEVNDLSAHDLDFYRAQGFAYIVGSSNRWGQYALPTRYAHLVGAGPVADFGPQEFGQMLGPRLLVFSTNLNAEAVPLPLAGEGRVGGARLLGVSIGSPDANDAQPPMIVPTDAFRAGGVLGLRTYWQIEAPLPVNQSIFVHILDAAGNRPTQRDAPPWQGRFPTETWQPGTIVVTADDVYLPPGMAPGEYRIVIGMYDPETFARPPVTLAGVPVPEAQLEVGPFTVTR